MTAEERAAGGHLPGGELPSGGNCLEWHKVDVSSKIQRFVEVIRGKLLLFDAKNRFEQ